MTVLDINNKAEYVWRCQALISGFQTFRRVRSVDFGTPDRLETSFRAGPHYYLEVVLTDRILVCWTDSQIKADDVSGIDTVAKTLQLKTGGIVSCRITDRRPSVKEQEFIQQERLIASNYARAAQPSPFQSKLNEVDHNERILKVISGMMHEMERSPRAFCQKREEDLRAHILVLLNGHYEGRATGETFNYKGKTDILIRVEDRNIFIAECKIWKGAKSFKATIDQLLGYASRRDTCTAIILFSRNKSTSTVVSQIPDLVKQYSNFKRQITDYRHESGFRFLLQHPADKKHELTLTVLVFDVPSL